MRKHFDPHREVQNKQHKIMETVKIEVVKFFDQQESKLQVSEETQDYVELLKALEAFSNKVYQVIQKHYGDKQVDKITEEEFLKHYEGYQKRILHHMNGSILDKIYSTSLKDVI